MTNTETNPEIMPVKLPIFSTIFGCYSLFIDKFKQFVIWGTFFALILMVLYISSGQDVLCINKHYRSSHFCTENFYLFTVTHLISLFILCIFMRCWYQKVLQGKEFSFPKILTPQKVDCKIYGLFFAFLLSISVAGLSFYLLYIRIPNPDWRIELAYFGVVSLGFLVPLLALRFICYFAFAAENEPLPSIKILWKKTAGRSFLILSSLLFLVIIGLFLSQSLMHNFMITQDVNHFYIILGSEYLSNIAIIFVAACFMNYCYLQKYYLFERDINEKSEN